MLGSFPASACVPGWAHCSTNPDDGCETDVTLPANCGGCGTKCPADNPLCTGAACGNACPSGTPTQCGMTCVDLKTDPSHCGTCDKSCTQPASGGNATCANQVCGVACLSGFHLCPGTTVCASDTDAAHCGAQCQSCAGGANGDPACVNGGCSISCHAGYHLCSGACVSNSDATHCGAQCQQCPGDPNGDAACVNSGCGISCHNGFHACGNVCASDTDATHCGTSCATCATGQICSSGSCACAPNTHACPSMAGCYADSVNTCGINCTKCPTVSNGSYSCQSGGVCALACDQGFLQCNGSPRTCATNNWSFESNTAEGFQLLSAGTISDASEGFSVSTARAAQGTHSIAVPATYNCDRRIIEVGVYPCNLSPANLVGKTLRFQVFVDGPAFLDGQRQSGVTILNGQSATINVDLVVGQWQVVSSVLTDPANGSASGFKFSLYMVPTGPPPGNVCMQWSGTIYLDDFSLQ